MVRLWWLEAAATLGFEEEGEVKSVTAVFRLCNSSTPAAPTSSHPTTLSSSVRAVIQSKSLIPPMHPLNPPLKVTPNKSPP